MDEDTIGILVVFGAIIVIIIIACIMENPYVKTKWHSGDEEDSNKNNIEQ